MRTPAWVGGCIVVATATAVAHGGSIERHQAGPYRFEMVVREARSLATQPLHVAIRVVSPGGAPPDAVVVTVKGIPGVETPAVPTRTVQLRSTPQTPGAYDGAVLLSVIGVWDLEVNIAGPDGAGTARIPIAVTAPWVIPGWAGWIAGSSPLWGLVWFIVWQRRYLRHLRATIHLAN